MNQKLNGALNSLLEKSVKIEINVIYNISIIKLLNLTLFFEFYYFKDRE